MGLFRRKDEAPKVVDISWSRLQYDQGQDWWSLSDPLVPDGPVYVATEMTQRPGYVAIKNALDRDTKEILCFMAPDDLEDFRIRYEKKRPAQVQK